MDKWIYENSLGELYAVFFFNFFIFCLPPEQVYLSVDRTA